MFKGLPSKYVKAIVSKAKAFAKLEDGRFRFLPLPAHERLQSMLTVQRNAAKPNIEVVASTWRASNLMIVSALLDAIHSIELDVEFWENSTDWQRSGIWIRGRELFSSIESSPSALSIAIVKKYVALLYMHVGVLKMIAGQSLVVGQHHMSTTCDPNETIREAVICCDLNAALLRILARADQNREIYLEAVNLDLEALLGSAFNPSTFSPPSEYSISRHVALGFDDTGNFLKSIDDRSSPPSIREYVESVRKQLTSMHSESDFRNLLIRVSARQGCTRPSSFERHACAYAGLSGLVLMAGKSLQSRSSTLGGNGQLEFHLHTAKTSLATFFNQQLVEPVHGIYEQVLANSPSAGEIVASNANSLRESRESLQRVLEQFKRDHPELAGSGMAPVLEAYERQIRQPIRSAVSGSLLETLLVITAKLKSDVEEILLRTAKQMSAQRINLHILAAVPAVLGVIGTLYAISAIVARSRRRGIELRSNAGNSVRYRLGDCRDVLFLLRQECADKNSQWQDRARLVGKLVGVIRSMQLLAARGAISLHADGVARFYQDLRVLESESYSISTKVAVIDRMFQVYPFSLHERISLA